MVDGRKCKKALEGSNKCPDRTCIKFRSRMRDESLACSAIVAIKLVDFIFFDIAIAYSFSRISYLYILCAFLSVYLHIWEKWISFFVYCSATSRLRDKAVSQLARLFCLPKRTLLSPLLLYHVTFSALCLLHY